MPRDLASFQRQFVQAIDRPASGPLAVYRNTVIHGAVEALQANYPVVGQIVGSEMFDGIAAEFAVARPPRSAVLALYGAEFADWIGQQPWSGDMPYLADVARVERLHIECLMASDAEPLSIESVTDIDLDRLHLNLHPALRFAWLSSPAMTIWVAHQSELASELEVEWSAEGAMFARPGRIDVRPFVLGRAAYRLLSGIRLGESAGRSTEATARLYPDERPEILFQSLVNLGAFAAPAIERT